MGAVENAAGVAWLVPIAGPMMPPIELTPSPRGLLVGRLDHCDVQLSAESVSRHHARLMHGGSCWSITDLKSRWGTVVNGAKIAPEERVALGENDLVGIIPWTFVFCATAQARDGLVDGATEALDDAVELGKSFRTGAVDRWPSMRDEMLSVLMDAAAALHGATDEKTLAHILLEKATLGSGLPNAAYLKHASGPGRYEIIAARFPGTGQMAYSRSLLSAAASGEMAELSADRLPADLAHSIVSLGVKAALCVPIMLGQVVAAFLYLDVRAVLGANLRLMRPNAAEFCRSLGQMAGLALANIRRMEFERRNARIQGDLSAAAAAQRWILPPPQDQLGRFSYRALSEEGEFCGGDFFDVLWIDEHQLAIAIGDVAGHGVEASVLISASAGFLHAQLARNPDPADAANRLNAFVFPRRPEGRFLTLWVGLLHLKKRELTYVDAGHGYVLLNDESGGMNQLPGEGHFPIGIEETCVYKSTAVSLGATGQMLLISDGIVEQSAPTADARNALSFGLAGVGRAVHSTPAEGDVVAAIIEAVRQHAGRSRLADDATAVLVKW